MDWKELYQSRLCSAEEAVSHIKSGDKVVLAHCAAEPPVLVDAMVASRSAYKDVEISHMFSLGKGEYCRPEYAEYFRFNGWFVNGETRKAVEQGHGDYTPVFFHEVPAYIRKGIFKVDVFMVMVSPPDEDGYCSTGVSADYAKQAVESAKIVLAEVNDQVPVVQGDCMIHVSQIDWLTETSHPLPELPLPKIGEIELAIGRNCAELIEDGATLQLGIGAIPDAVLKSLTHKKNLGIHSEMFSDGAVDLFEAGVIDNSQKAIDQGKMVATFLMGSKRLYDFVDRNPAVELRSVDYVNHPAVIAKSSKLVCINGGLAVDFLGQVVSDTIGTRQFSGVGGQVDFCRGAAMAEDGRGINIIAMPSVAKKKDGTLISKIAQFIDTGAAVTTSRQDVDYIVTEYGAAHLKGKTVKDRARSLIAIAHPDFREQLKAEFEERFHTAFEDA